MSSNMKIPALIAGLLILATLAPMNATDVQSDGDAPLVQVMSTKCDHHALFAKWRITNNADKQIFVYSTFLHGPAAELERSGRVLVVHTSITRKSHHIAVNYYPPATFIEIEPGSSIVGDFKDRDACSNSGKTGPTSVALSLAFGFEIESVKKALSTIDTSEEHPANPIVDWRKIAQSEPVPLSR